MACKHEIYVSARFGEPYYCQWDGELKRDWIPAQKVTAFEDIDLHRMVCSICGEIAYYSQTAREHFQGIKNSDLIENSLNRMSKRNRL